MAEVWEYRKDAEGPSFVAHWYTRDDDGNSILKPLSGATLTAELVHPETNVVAKAVGSGQCQGANTKPNVKISWQAAFFNDAALATDVEYELWIKADEGGTESFFRPEDPPRIKLLPVPTSP